MKHYLNVCDVNGATVEPVDMITFGSPCQDLSVAGKRAGLKHESNGDEETTRSGLFMEAVRIIKEMRKEDELRQLRSGRSDEFIRPRFAVWENVPGAFSSNKGEDFRIVLEELASVKDTEVSIPMPDKGKWQPAGEIVGNGWSIAWRTLDAQYHGVPQRRRRIFLVADFADQCAGEILFECKGLPGYPSESSEKGQGTSGDSSESTGRTGEGTCIGFDGYNQAVTGDVSKAITSAATDADHVPLVFQGKNAVPYTLKIRSGCEGGGKGVLIQTDKSATLAVAQDQTLFQPIAYGICSYASNSMKSDNPHSGIYVADTSRTLDLNGGNPACNQGGICICEPLMFENHSQDTRYRGPLDVAQPVTANYGMGGNNQPFVLEPTYGMTVETFFGVTEGKANTLKARDYKDPQCVCYTASSFGGYTEGCETLKANGGDLGGGSETLAVEKCEIKYIVRRLTPTECARLQGMPDAWCRLSQIEDMPDEDYEFWKQAHFEKWKLDKLDNSMDEDEIEFRISKYKHKTKEQMIKWYNGLQSDAPEYKAYGNGMALPCVRVPIHGIAQHGAKTMASLFDGIGGFPLAGLIDGIETLWTSEVELFPIAVTIERFREYEQYGCFTFGSKIEKEKKEMGFMCQEEPLPFIPDETDISEKEWYTFALKMDKSDWTALQMFFEERHIDYKNF